MNGCLEAIVATELSGGHARDVRIVRLLSVVTHSYSEV